ncbi:lysophospholipid acyltransferase family protein [Sphingomonas sp. Mn802worker]|uniref:lysophospholipid acyltransferase family protein n=1 Tax=Sphingomonas sp. Mn802worker TaxID=629773 RepID=UPI0003815FF6|nr:lysophospholipid acyltransferase family protein [Sphingomonas sp. Mn802worker]
MADVVRTWLFRLFFAIGSLLVVIVIPFVALFGQRAMIAYSHGWARYHGMIARWIMGVHTEVSGVPLPSGPVLYAAKHEAMYETLELPYRLGGPAVVIKRELAQIPLWGWAARIYGALPVDREASAKALRTLMSDAAVFKAQGRSVIVFPEGSRMPHGERPPLRSGFAGLYRALGYPVVPIALDSGRRWPRNGHAHPGPVRVLIGEAIPPGLPRREVEQRVHAAINALNN